jgi:hypothetical protein
MGPWRRGFIALSLLAAACGSSGAKPDGASACTPVVAPLPDAGTNATRGYYPPTRWMLGPIYGTGCPLWGECESGGTTMMEEVNYHLDQLAANDIPITLYHFDGQGWSASETCDWSLGDALRDRLAATGLRALLHFWGGCYGEADFDHVYAQLGHTLAGFYLDDGSTDALAKTASDWVQSQMPGDSEVVMKGYQTDSGETEAGLTTYGHSCYVNDLPTNFDGLKEGIRRVLSLADVLPAPFNELTGYSSDRPDEETFYRRIHFGAMQVVMDHSPDENASPWNTSYYSDNLLRDYRYFAWLHKELVPYLHSYDWNAYETGEPILRGADAGAFTTRIGEEIFVAYVTDPVATNPELGIALPPGEWIDYWDPRDVVSGTLHRTVPLGKEPIFIASGAIIPMDVSRAYTGHGTAASAGSLTVLVYPNGDSSFRYRDDTANSWVAFTAHQSGARLELAASAGLSQPILYRVERMTSAPASVSICGAFVVVNGAAGIAAAANENAVNGAAAAAWFYDGASQRLIVKAFP